jgi:hypothetical protein
MQRLTVKSQPLFVFFFVPLVSCVFESIVADLSLAAQAVACLRFHDDGGMGMLSIIDF